MCAFFLTPYLLDSLSIFPTLQFVYYPNLKLYKKRIYLQCQVTKHKI